ncbi:sce7726 family protein [Pseudomonas sp. TNT2022 ID233]|uniref:sce7726 family protein n=1 Tax=Pseudomonas aphyarum TaxID=2942629 RepID=UPI00235E679C|nr:sce7726 family protein [Pseudomonas aphyarum]MDD1136724.1 sce7726 family protein [Pseudomonas aphyarum]
MLNDSSIRGALLARLRNAHPQPKALIEELRVHNGNAIADVVAVHREAHCYEIKGDGDKIERIAQQGFYYDLAFRKVTLVTTTKHVAKAIKIAPNHWGILEAKYNPAGKVIFKPIRQVQKSAAFDKQIALLTLWRNELFDIASEIEEKVQTKINRNALSALISQAFGAQELSLTIGKALVLRSIIKDQP